MKAASFVLMVAIAIAFAGTASGQVANDRSAAPAVTGTTVVGNVSAVALGDNTFTITADDGTSMTFKFDNGATVPQNLSAGQRVRVSYDNNPGSDNSYHAAVVTLEGSNSSMSGSQSSTTPPVGSSYDRNPGSAAADRPTGSAYDRTTGAAADRTTGSAYDRDNATTTPGSNRMPATASPLPLVGLAGGLALAAAAGLRLAGRH